MKSDHRHELQQNELRKLARRMEPWVRQHGMQIVWGLGALLVIGVAVLIFSRRGDTAGAAGWTLLSTAQSTEDFAAVAEKHGDALPGVWARLRAAELNLENGILEAFSDREVAQSDLKRAKEDFEKVLAAKITLPAALKERALLGLARCLEATCDGDTQPAIEAYQTLLRQFPDGVYKNHVEQRTKELQTGRAKEFYAWFHAQKPKPPDFRRPADGARPSSSPFDDFELPAPSQPSATGRDAGTETSTDDAPADATAPAQSVDPPK
jgi:hypothetical protein